MNLVKVKSFALKPWIFGRCLPKKSLLILVTGLASVLGQAEVIPPLSPNLPDEITHCTWTTAQHTHYSFSSPMVGQYNLCVAKDSSYSIYLQFAEIPDAQICLIPATHQGEEVMMIGNPLCFWPQGPQKIQQLSFNTELTNDRFPLDGVIIIKDQLAYYGAPFKKFMLPLDAYLTCQRHLTYGDHNFCQAVATAQTLIDHRF